MFSGAPELPRLNPIHYYLAISGAPDTRVTRDFGMFTESSMLNNVQSIAHENCSQLLDSTETDPVQYIANYPGIDRLSKRYRVDASHPEKWLMYSRLTHRIGRSISLLRNESSGTLQIHCPVEVDGLRFDTARIFHSPANSDPQTLIVNI